MQKKFLLGGMILTSGLGLASGAFANTNTNTPEHLSEFNILSSTDIASLSSLTPSERDSFLRSKGLLHIDRMDQADLEIQPGTLGQNRSFRRVDATGTRVHLTRLISQDTTPSSSQNRADRITANQTKMVQKRIDTIQKKLYNKESLTRLEKKFAIENSISFPVVP